MHNRIGISDALYKLLAKGVEGADSLVELALDMRWSWNHVTDDLWEELDPEL
jgi:glycogen phosphorylase